MCLLTDKHKGGRRNRSSRSRIAIHGALYDIHGLDAVMYARKRQHDYLNANMPEVHNDSMCSLNWVAKKKGQRLMLPPRPAGGVPRSNPVDVNSQPPTAKQLPNRDQLLGMKMYKKMQKTYHAQTS